MTLPFRRRHHDDEAPHDRARALISAGFLGPVSEADEGWLEGHLERCPECRADRAGYLADRSLLQSLRQSPPSPPRDLWARTAAAIERESSHSRRSLLGRAIGPKPRGIPLGPLAGVVVAAVVLVVALLPPGTTIAPSRTATPPVVAQATPGRTPLTVDNQVAWLQHEPDGSYSIVFGEVDQVCADPDTSACVIAPGSPAPIAIAAQPQSVVLSPDSNQVAVVPADDQPDGDLVIVSVPTPAPSEPATSFGTRSAPPTSRPSAPPATAPIESPGASPLPSASAGPIPNGHAIIHGVAIVGEPAYSADGQWFAFSARPKVGLRGPDLYVWHVGDDAATQLTDDGLTYFAGWYRNQIVASTVTLGSSTTTLDGGQAGAGSASPTAPAPASPVPASAPASPGAADSPLASDSPSEPAGVELHPTSFLLDPTTRTRTDFARPDVWLPSIDPTGHFVVYWSGTVAADPMTSAAPAGSSPSGVPVFVFGGVRSLRPATGSLVLDGWTAPLVLPSASPAASDAAQSAPPPTPTEA
ncbi:MAG TPA: zf-HC2 domain-containing protein, partial [Candidatus Limnocylindrales bacterium]